MRILGIPIGMLGLAALAYGSAMLFDYRSTATRYWTFVMRENAKWNVRARTERAQALPQSRLLHLFGGILVILIGLAWVGIGIGLIAQVLG